jgi:hypothetical protein
MSSRQEVLLCRGPYSHPLQTFKKTKKIEIHRRQAHHQASAAGLTTRLPPPPPPPLGRRTSVGGGGPPHAGSQGRSRPRCTALSGRRRPTSSHHRAGRRGGGGPRVPDPGPPRAARCMTEEATARHGRRGGARGRGGDDTGRHSPDPADEDVGRKCRPGKEGMGRSETKDKADVRCLAAESVLLAGAGAGVEELAAPHGGRTRGRHSAR